MFKVEGRTATCVYCGRKEPSSRGLAFFEYLGTGSEEADGTCHCGYAELVHQEINPYTGRKGVTDHEFQPKGPRETDRYYCGCRGWD
jgi:hypothetical protein